MSTQAPTPTHKAVQAYYGNLARQSGSCCGASSSPQELHNVLYPVEMLSSLPPDIANFTEGSGNPITLANLKPGEFVLDLGSGGGLDCFLAARRVGENGHVIGVDMTPEMLERAKSNARRLKIRNVEFRAGLLESLPVEDASTDVIISNCVINLSPDKPQVFSEMLRVLKPGGRIAVSDMLANHPITDETHKGEDWCSCMSGALERKECIEALRKAGFVDIHTEPDIVAVLQVVESGQARTKSGEKISREEVMESLQNWEKVEGTLVVPHKITASKPA